MKTGILDQSDLLASTADAGPAKSLLANLVDRLRKASAERSLRRQLAEMDSALLRDIGIAEDEIDRVRRYDQFTPRAWMQ